MYKIQTVTFVSDLKEVILKTAHSLRCLKRKRNYSDTNDRW